MGKPLPMISSIQGDVCQPGNFAVAIYTVKKTFSQVHKNIAERPARLTDTPAHTYCPGDMVKIKD